MFSYLVGLEKIPHLVNFFISYNAYPKNFIDKYFKKFLDNIHLVKENVPTVQEKRLLLVLPYLGVITLQSRTKLQQAFKHKVFWIIAS